MHSFDAIAYQTYYFSTQGCVRPSDCLSCFKSGAAFAAAAAFRAFRSKKLAICEIMNVCLGAYKEEAQAGHVASQLFGDNAGAALW